MYECSQEVVISTAANPLYGGLGAPPAVTNGPVYDTVGNTADEYSLCKPHIVCDTGAEPSKPPSAAAEVVYDTVYRRQAESHGSSTCSHHSIRNDTQQLYHHKALTIHCYCTEPLDTVCNGCVCYLCLYNYACSFPF